MILVVRRRVNLLEGALDVSPWALHIVLTDDAHAALQEVRNGGHTGALFAFKLEGTPLPSGSMANEGPTFVAVGILPATKASAA